MARKTRDQLSEADVVRPFVPTTTPGSSTSPGVVFLLKVKIF